MADSIADLPTIRCWACETIIDPQTQTVHPFFRPVSPPSLTFPVYIILCSACDAEWRARLLSLGYEARVPEYKWGR